MVCAEPMTKHTVVIDGRMYRPGDVVLDANEQAWQAVQCISASGENTVAFEQVGQPKGQLTYYPPRPLEPMVTHSRFMHEVGEMIKANQRLVDHSVFAYPHFQLWHWLFDGTWLCRCWHSQEMKT